MKSLWDVLGPWGLTLCGLFVVSFLAWLLVWLPRRQASRLPVAGAERARLINEFRRTLAQIIGGAILLGGAYGAWQQVQVAREGQITESFTRAIEQLGHRESQVRLGGIYGLERIARESEQEHPTIAAVLSAYVRAEAPWVAETVHASHSLEHKRLNTDIQAALTVLGRRVWRGTKHQRIDLSDTDLRFAHLEGAYLVGAVIKRTSMFKARLFRARLDAVLLNYADLRQANLTEVILRRSGLHGARLDSADFRHATGLTLGQIQSAHIDKNTKLPDYIVREMQAKQEGQQGSEAN